jgi:hypothetical protein
MPNTSRLSFPYPADAAAIDVPSDLQSLATAIDGKLNFTTITTTKGDLLRFDGTDPQRLPVGANAYVLASDSSVVNKVAWATNGTNNIPANGWHRIASDVTSGSAVTAVTFSSIPQTYTDLMIIWYMVVATGSPSVNMTYNGTVTTNTQNTHCAMLTAGSTTVTSQVNTNVRNFLTCAFTTTPLHMQGRAIIQNYTQGVTGDLRRNLLYYSSGVSSTGVTQYWGSGEDQATSANVSSIVLTASVASSIGIGSRFSLYGQKKL